VTIHIEELSFDTIIGILDFERTTPQKVIIDATIDYSYKKEDKFINYAELISLIEKEMQQKKYLLLEEALNELTNKIVSLYPQIEKFNLKITKPNIINNAKVALSSSWIKE